MQISQPQPTNDGAAEYFTGEVFLDPLYDAAQPPSKITLAHVHFTPGARTNWHRHPVGQTLYCTDGIGIVQVRGQQPVVLTQGMVVHIAANEEHWHGSRPGHFMSHLAITEKPDDGGPGVEWDEPVAEADYQSTAE